MEDLASLVEAKQDNYGSYMGYTDLHSRNAAIANTYPHIARLERVGYSGDHIPQFHPNGRLIEALVLSNQEHEDERPYVLLQTEHEDELLAHMAVSLVSDVICSYPELLDMFGVNLITLNTATADGLSLQRWGNTDQAEAGAYGRLRCSFRPAASEQIAWGYRWTDSDVHFTHTKPEVQASMKLMRKYKPIGLLPVHNSGISDVYYFSSHRDGQLLDDLASVALRSGLQMQRGEPELPYVGELAPGIYHPVPSGRLAHDFQRRNLGDNTKWHYGTTSAGYLSTKVANPFVVLSEFSNLTAGALHDTGPSGKTRREAGLEGIAKTEDIRYLVNEYFDGLSPIARQLQRAPGLHVVGLNRLMRSVRWWCKQFMPILLEAEKQNLGAEKFDREATVAEAYSAVYTREYYDLRFLGEMSCIAWWCDMYSSKELDGILKAKVSEINEASPLQATPLSTVVGAQALSVLVSLRHLKHIR